MAGEYFSGDPRMSRRAVLSAMAFSVAGALTGCSLVGQTGNRPTSAAPFPSASASATPPPSAVPSPVAMPVPAKGVGTWATADGSKNLADSGAHWYYTWKPTPDGLATPSGVEFVPMIPDLAAVTVDSLALAAKSGTALLGFNEPDHAQQANMSVETAVDAWPLLEGTGLRLGAPAGAGPATASNGWIAQFMAAVQAKGYRVDFMPIHTYGVLGEAPTNGILTSLSEYLTAVHDLYGLPIWVTEMAMIPWGNLDQLPDPAGEAEFLVAAQATMSALPFVERYAWFSLPYWATAPTISLYTQDGSRSAVGDTFRNLP